MVHERSEFLIINYSQMLSVDNILDVLKGTISKIGHLRTIL
jgi:hypothetical protein